MVRTQKLPIDSLRELINYPDYNNKNCYIEVLPEGAILVIGEPDSNTSICFGAFEDRKKLKIWGTGW